MPFPVMSVEGPQPDWWLWDSHEASEAEVRASSWKDIKRALRANAKLLELFPPT